MPVWVDRRQCARGFPLERLHRALLHNGLGAPTGRGGVLERLLAGVIVIGLLLWGASVLATPDAATPEPREDAPEDRDDRDHRDDDDDPSSTDRDGKDDEDEEDSSGPGKRKKDRDG